ncbi:type-F conjugative transfer system pilin assembly protein TraF [soil metagenome]
MSAKTLLITSLMAVVIFAMPSIATASDYYEHHEKGWHWYDDPMNQTPPETKDAKEVTEDPILQMATVKQAIKRALDNAILHPTTQNVKNYILLQNQLSTNASQFSHTWQQVLVENPSLDYSVTHPSNQVGHEVFVDQTQAKQSEAIRELAKHSGLFFFYHSSCPYCQRFAPILKDFASQHHIAVVAITTDGVALPAFPNSRIDSGQAKQFHVTMEPALFTVNPTTHKVIPVAYGLLSQSELRQRIYDIATNYKGEN